MHIWINNLRDEKTIVIVMSEDNLKIEYRNYVVAFIDVLGQKEAFKSLDKFQIIENSEECKNAIKSMHTDATFFIKTLRDQFVDFFNSLAVKNTIPTSIPKEKRELFEEVRKINLKYKSYSDSMQFFVSLKTDRFHCQAMNSIYAILVATGGLLLATFAEKKVFRAGIDIGIGVEIENDEVYGPALFRAYDLESRIAQLPRIVIGDALINYLRNLAEGTKQVPNQISEDIEICKSLAKKCLGFLKEDIDGYIILDYLGDNFSGGVLKQSDYPLQDVFDLAFNFIRSEYLKFKNIRDSKLSHRYHWLYQYFLYYKSKKL